MALHPDSIRKVVEESALRKLDGSPCALIGYLESVTEDLSNVHRHLGEPPFDGEHVDSDVEMILALAIQLELTVQSWNKDQVEFIANKCKSVADEASECIEQG